MSALHSHGLDCHSRRIALRLNYRVTAMHNGPPRRFDVTVFDSEKTKWTQMASKNIRMDPRVTGDVPVEARQSFAEHLIATKSAALHSYGLDAHCRSVLRQSHNRPKPPRANGGLAESHTCTQTGHLTWTWRMAKARRGFAWTRSNAFASTSA